MPSGVGPLNLDEELDPELQEALEEAEAAAASVRPPSSDIEDGDEENVGPSLLDLDDVVLDIERISVRTEAGGSDAEVDLSEPDAPRDESHDISQLGGEAPQETNGSAPGDAREKLDEKPVATGGADIAEEAEAEVAAVADTEAHDPPPPAAPTAPPPPPTSVLSEPARSATPADPFEITNKPSTAPQPSPTPVEDPAAEVQRRSPLAAVGIAAVVALALGYTALSFFPSDDGASTSAASRTDPMELARNSEARARQALVEGDLDEARIHFERSLTRYRQHRQPSDEARIAVALAELEQKSDDSARALELYERAATTYGLVGQDKDAESARQAAATVETTLAASGKLRPYLLERLEKFALARNYRGRIETLPRLIELDEDAGRIADARHTAQQLVALLEQREDWTNAATALDWLAKLDRVLADDTSLRRDLNRALEHRRTSGDSDGVANTREAIADLDAANGRFDDARGTYTQLVDTYDGSDRARVLLKLGDVERMRGSQDSAVERYRVVLDACTFHRDTNCQAEAQRRFAAVHAFNHRFEPAMAAYRQAGDLFASTKNRLAEVEVLAQRSVLSQRSGDPLGAEIERQQAYAIAKTITGPEQSIGAWVALAKGAEMSGDRTFAHDAYAAALRRYEEIGSVHGQIRVLDSLQYLDGDDHRYRKRLAELRDVVSRSSKS